MFGLSRSLFDDLFSLHTEIDNLIEKSWGSSARWLPTFGGQNMFSPEVEPYTKDGSIVYRLAIPGVDPKDVDLSIVGNQVTVKGQRSAPTEVNDENWYVRKFCYGQFEWTFTLPEGMEADKVNATFSNGGLELSAPLSKAHLPRKIEIKQIGSGEKKPQLKASA
jgi:HSP20 family protein